jgi:MFS family permease
LVPVFVIGTLATLVGWIVWVISTNVRRGQATQKVAALHAKVLDRCADSNELLRYLESDQGRRFLESATEEASLPAARILGAIQAGLVIGALGVAGLIVRDTLHYTDERDSMLIFGTAALAIGVGFLISAVASYLLSKSWGLLKPRSSRI